MRDELPTTLKRLLDCCSQVTLQSLAKKVSPSILELEGHYYNEKKKVYTLYHKATIGDRTVETNSKHSNYYQWTVGKSNGDYGDEIEEVNKSNIKIKAEHRPINRFIGQCFTNSFMQNTTFYFCARKKKEDKIVNGKTIYQKYTYFCCEDLKEAIEFMKWENTEVFDE